MSVDLSSANSVPNPPDQPERGVCRSIFRRTVWVLNGPWINRDATQTAFDEQRKRVPRGVWTHGLIAGIVLACLPGPTAISEIAILFLLGFFLLRSPKTWKTWVHSLGQPVPLIILIWVIWQFVTLAWSPDVNQGLNEIGSTRWALLILLLWPSIEWRHRWLLFLAVGFFAGHVAQLSQFIWQGEAWFPWVRERDRLSGWWDPAIAGTLLTAALGLHLPAAIMGTGRTRLIGLGCSGITLVALLAPGTRGGWLAAIALIGVTLCVAVFVSRQRKVLLVVVGALALFTTIAGITLRSQIAGRVDEARIEIAQALSGENYTSATGARIAMAGWAVEAFLENPIGGVGAGGYHDWVVEHLQTAEVDLAERSVHHHAHNTLLQIAATSGFFGLFIAALFVISALWNAFSGLTRATLGSYAAGPGFALLGLLFVSAFDVVHINSQSTAILAVLLALTPTYVPESLLKDEKD